VLLVLTAGIGRAYATSTLAPTVSAARRTPERQAQRTAAGKCQHGEHRLGPYATDDSASAARLGGANDLRIRS
jgi:hypothetical protein